MLNNDQILNQVDFTLKSDTRGAIKKRGERGLSGSAFATLRPREKRIILCEFV